MSNFSEAYARDPDIAGAVKHARISQAIECVRMLRWMRRNPPNRNAASLSTLKDAETYLLAGARRLKRGERFWTSTSVVDSQKGGA